MPPIKFNMPATIRLIVISVAIGFLCGLFTCKSCTKPCKDVVVKEEKKSDTTKIQLPSQSTDFHSPVLVLEGEHIPIQSAEWRVDVLPTIDLSPIPADTNAIIQPYINRYNNLLAEYQKMWDDYSKVRQYTDTNRFTNGRTITDSYVSSNKLQKTKTTLDSLQQVIITNTITRTIAEKRTIAYLGLRGGYNLSDSTMAVGGAVKLKFKNDIQLGLSGKVNSKSQFILGVEFDVPVRLKKRQ